MWEILKVAPNLDKFSEISYNKNGMMIALGTENGKVIIMENLSEDLGIATNRTEFKYLIEF